MTARSAAAAIVTLLAAPAAVVAQQEGPYEIPPAPAATAPLPPLEPVPALRRAAVLDVVRGRVTYRRPGARRHRRLVGPTSVPFGTVVDARRGRVRLIVARNRRGATESAVFYAGRFSVRQGGGSRPVTTLRLLGAFRTRCAPGARASARKPRRRRLWGDGKGRFRTRGRYSAATVRGTKWLVEDRCDGTLTRVARGEVEVVDYTATAAPDPAPPSGGGEQGGGSVGGEDEGAPAPSFSPAAPAKPRRVRVRRGGRHLAGPGR